MAGVPGIIKPSLYLKTRCYSLSFDSAINANRLPGSSRSKPS